MSGNQFFTILTDIGQRKFRDAIAVGGCINLRDIAVGDGGGLPTDPSSTMTSLVNEVYRAPISNNTHDPVNPAYAILNLVIPIEVGGWYVREAGVYDADGDLIFVGSLPSTYKPLPSMGVASDLSINLIIDVENAETITITVDPATVLASQAWAEQAIADAIDAAWNNHVCECGTGGGAGLETELVLYVREDGDDSWDGRSQQTAKASIRGAITAASRYTLRENGRVVIDLGEGEFASPGNLTGAIVQCSGADEVLVELRGAGKDKTSVIGPITLRAVPQLVIRDLAWAGPISAYDNSNLHVYSLRMEGVGKRGMQVGYSAVVTFLDDGSEMEGDFTEVFAVWGMGVLWIKLCVLTFTGPTRFTTFADVASSGMFAYQGNVAGMEHAQGQRWKVTNGGVLCTYGIDPDTFPGTEAGTSELPAITGVKPPESRDRATDDVLIHVSEDGDDANDGLTEETATRTISGALDVLARLDLGRKRAILNIGAGEYASPVLYGEATLGNGRTGMCLEIQGAGKDLTVLKGNLYLVGTAVFLKNLCLHGALRVCDSGTGWLDDVRIRGNGSYGFYAYRGGTIALRGDVEAEGTFSKFIRVVLNGLVNLEGHTLTISGPMTSTIFCYASTAGCFHSSGRIAGGENVTGQKWSLAGGGLIDIRGQNPDAFFPGTQVGSADDTNLTLANLEPTETRTRTLTDNGYAKMAGGLILQWGYADFPTGVHTVELMFPLAFPNACLSVQATDSVSNPVPENVGLIAHGPFTKTGVSMVTADSFTSRFRWFALGY